jgi:hypothetical protein
VKKTTDSYLQPAIQFCWWCGVVGGGGAGYYRHLASEVIRSGRTIFYEVQYSIAVLRPNPKS